MHSIAFLFVRRRITFKGGSHRMCFHFHGTVFKTKRIYRLKFKRTASNVKNDDTL